MIQKKLYEIAEMVNGELILQTEYDEITGVNIDSRTIKENNLYIPIKGEKFDGHTFIQDVVMKKATATLWDKKNSLPTGINVILVDDTLVALQKLAQAYLQQLPIKIIGITGSNGKTSIKDILFSVLQTKFKVKATLGNRNNEIGLPLTILDFEEDDEIGILEMGMENFDEISLLSKIAQPEIAIISNIGTAHISQLKSRENIAKAKLEILDGLKANGILIVDENEPLLHGKYYNTNYFNINLITNFKQNFDGIVFEYENEIFSANVLGKHQVANILAVIKTAQALSFTNAEIKQALNNLTLTKMRNDFYKYKDVYILDDSYKSNPESLQAALETLAEFDLQKIVVLADMLDLGEKKIAYHEEVGRKLKKYHIAKAYFYGPLSKYSAQASDIETYYFEDKDALAKKLGKEKNCVILFKASRGLKMEDVIAKFKEEKN